MKMLRMPGGNWLATDYIVSVKLREPFPLDALGRRYEIAITLEGGAEEKLPFYDKTEAEVFRDQIAEVVNGNTPQLNQVPIVHATVQTTDPRAFAKDCVKAIEDDLMTRPSLRPGYMSLNGSVCEEIMATWATIIESKLRSL